MNIHHDGGSLSFTTPDLLVNVIDRLKAPNRVCLMCNVDLKGKWFGRKYCSNSCKRKASYKRNARKLGHLPFVERRKLMILGNK